MSNAYTKLHVFNLTQYEHVTFIDKEALLLSARAEEKHHHLVGAYSRRHMQGKLHRGFKLDLQPAKGGAVAQYHERRKRVEAVVAFDPTGKTGGRG